ncbi:MAG: CxxC-x17-CxxC domain-containing protein [Candidatus Aenigmatarchaeota archaeon]
MDETKTEEQIEEEPVEEETSDEEVEEDQDTDEEVAEEPKAEASTGFDREMHKTKCSDCGNECEVPFKPAADRPVYCKDCYRKHKPRRF